MKLRPEEMAPKLNLLWRNHILDDLSQLLEQVIYG